MPEFIPEDERNLYGCMDEVEFEFQDKLYSVQSSNIYLNGRWVGEVKQDGTLVIDDDDEEIEEDEEIEDDDEISII